jgi:integrase
VGHYQDPTPAARESRERLRKMQGREKSSATTSAYTTGLRQFLKFASEVLLMHPNSALPPFWKETPGIPIIELFIANRSVQITPATMRQYITALEQWCLALGSDGVRSNEHVTKLLRTMSKTDFAKPGSGPRTPVHVDIVKTVLQEAGNKVTEPGVDSLEILRICRNALLMSIGFFGMFRRSDLVNLRADDTHLINNTCHLTLRGGKVESRVGVCPTVIIPIRYKHLGIDLRDLIDTYTRTIRSITRGGTGPSPLFPKAFCPVQGHLPALLPADVTTILRTTISDIIQGSVHNYASHSLRRGGATYYLAQGVAPELVKHLGRWKATDTLLRYVEVASETIERMGNQLT